MDWIADAWYCTVNGLDIDPETRLKGYVFWFFLAIAICLFAKYVDR